MAAPELGVGAFVAAGVGVGAWADDDVAGVIAELPAGYVPQPPSATALRITAAVIRTRILVKRLGGRPVTDDRVVAGRGQARHERTGTDISRICWMDETPTCRYCGSTQLSRVTWQELLPGMQAVDAILIFDGPKPIPPTLTFCDSCGEWLPSSLERKQTEELIAVLRLMNAVPTLIKARLEHSDRPDIRMHLGGHVFGLEVTRIARDGAGAIAHAHWRRAVERTGRLLRRRNGRTSAWVSLRWNPNPPRASAQEIAALLVDLVETCLSTVPNKKHAMGHVEPNEVPEALLRYVHGLTVARTATDDHWVSGYTNYPDVMPEEIQTEIDGKANLAGGYQADTGGPWLLIYAEPTNAAQALDLTDAARSADYSGGPFQRVFFLDCIDRAAELRLR